MRGGVRFRKNLHVDCQQKPEGCVGGKDMLQGGRESRKKKIEMFPDKQSSCQA